jgi:hypothetical protein
MALSSINFQGKGESAVPAAPPRAKAKKLLLSIFIDVSSLRLQKDSVYKMGEHIIAAFIYGIRNSRP